LHYLPFNALHDGNAFLVDLYSLRMLPSASVSKYVRSQQLAKPGRSSPSATRIWVIRAWIWPMPSPKPLP